MEVEKMDIKMKNKITMTVIGGAAIYWAFKQGFTFAGFVSFLVGIMLLGVAWMPDKKTKENKK